MVKPLVPPMVDILGPYVTTPQHVVSRPGETGDAAGAGFSWWQDCTDENAEDGTPIPAVALNNFKAQLLTFFLLSGASIDDTDEMLARAIRSQALNFAVAGGTASAITATLDPVPVAGEITTGFRFFLLLTNAITGPTTLNLGDGALPVLDNETGSPLIAGDAQPGQVVMVVRGTGNYRLMDASAISRRPTRFDQRQYVTCNSDGLPLLDLTSRTVTVTTANLFDTRLAFYDISLIAAGARQFAIPNLPNKTFHLRYFPPGGPQSPEATYPYGRFILYDLADVAYNPSALAESNIQFDAAPNNALLARITTDGANAITVLPLKNAYGLYAGNQRLVAYSTGGAEQPADTLTLNWSRVGLVTLRDFNTGVGGTTPAIYKMIATMNNRYSASFGVYGYLSPNLYFGAYFADIYGIQS